MVPAQVNQNSFLHGETLGHLRTGSQLRSLYTPKSRSWVRKKSRPFRLGDLLPHGSFRAERGHLTCDDGLQTLNDLPWWNRVSLKLLLSITFSSILNSKLRIQFLKKYVSVFRNNININISAVRNIQDFRVSQTPCF